MTARTIVADDLDAAIERLRTEGFRLDVIYPADHPSSAVMSRGEEQARIERPGAVPLPQGLPPFAPEFLIERQDSAAQTGRAGMIYRDLIPRRLGGRYIASHITIPKGGPVSDWVHYHRVLFQMIFVRRGWVKVVYEDQGQPFVMGEGDLVLQPPLIRHRVLESSPGLEVIEIGAPALHETFADHDLQLPNARATGRSYGAQLFLHHSAADAPWTPLAGGSARDTGLAQATGGLASAHVLRPEAGGTLNFTAHDGELAFGFVLDGTARLDHHGSNHLGPADAFVIPPGEEWALAQPSDDFRLLHVTTGRLDEPAPSPL